MGSQLGGGYTDTRNKIDKKLHTAFYEYLLCLDGFLAKTTAEIATTDASREILYRFYLIGQKLRIIMQDIKNNENSS